MKATKIASGFAVSALAAAVSMSAMAVKVNGDEQPDGTADFSGSVEFKTTITLDTAEAFQADTDGDSKANEDSMGGSMSFNVKDDNFKISFSIEEDGDDDDINFKVSNAIYDDGTWSISPTLGSLISTEGGIEGTGDPISYGVDGAFRFTDKTKAFGVRGLKVQMQLEDAAGDEGAVAYVDSTATTDPTFEEDASNGSDFGLAALAGFKAPGSQTEYTANLQYAEDAGEAANPFVGFKVDSKINRSLSAMALVNLGAAGGSLDTDAETATVFGAKVNWTNNDFPSRDGDKNTGMSAFGSVGSNDGDMTIQVGGNYTMELEENVSKASLDATVTVPTYDGANEKVDVTARLDQAFLYTFATVNLELETNTKIHLEVGTKSIAEYSAKAWAVVDTPDGGDADTSFGVEGTYSFNNGVEAGASFESKAGENALSDNAATNLTDAGPYIHTYGKDGKATELKIWADYELDGGAKLGAAYEMDTDGRRENEDDDHGPTKDRGDIQFTNKLVLTAGYSF